MTRGLSRFQVESQALLAGLIAGVLGAIIAEVVFWGRDAALWGAWSIGVVAGILVAVAVLLAAFLGYWRARYRPGQEWRLSLPSWKFIVDATAVALVHAIVATLLTWAVFILLQMSFQGLVLPAGWASIFIGVTTGLTAYWTNLSVSHLNTERMTTLLVVFMVVSILTSMATAPVPNWWEYHFSELGSFGTASSWLFNFSLISAGLLLVGFSLYLNRDLQALVDAGSLTNRRSPGIISGGFVIAGFALAGVGLVPVNVNLIIHNTFATGMLLVVAGILLASAWLLRGLPWQIIVMTYAFLAGIAISVVLFMPVGYFNLTALELIAFALIFAWVSVFIRMLSAKLATD